MIEAVTDTSEEGDVTEDLRVHCQRAIRVKESKEGDEEGWILRTFTPEEAIRRGLVDNQRLECVTEGSIGVVGW